VLKERNSKNNPKLKNDIFKKIPVTVAVLASAFSLFSGSFTIVLTKKSQGPLPVKVDQQQTDLQKSIATEKKHIHLACSQPQRTGKGSGASPPIGLICPDY
jgi:hypothetical protein